MDTIKNLIEGNITYRKEYYPHIKEELETLIKNGQKPEVLVITCCDSRITPFLITGCKPGDLFVVRNVGNFVPPFNDNDDNFQSFYAVIEYALNVLKISNIIVCGHTYCGACKSLYDDVPHSKEYTYIRKWLTLGEEAKQTVLDNKNLYKTKEELYRATEKQSLICQLNHLLTYPIINEQISSKQLNIFAWYYHLEDGSIEYYDTENKDFKDIIHYPLT